jgi:hypothetical protein
MDNLYPANPPSDADQKLLARTMAQQLAFSMFAFARRFSVSISYFIFFSQVILK